MKNKIQSFFIAFFSVAVLAGCSFQLNPMLIPQIGISMDVPIRINWMVARKYFPGLNATKERNQMIDCIADRKDHDIISKKCYEAQDFYSNICFNNILNNINECKALFNVISASRNFAMMKRLSHSTYGYFPPNPHIGRNGEWGFVEIH